VTLRRTLKDVVERTDTRAGRAFDLAIQALIVISLITFAVETLPDLPVGVQQFLAASEVVIVLLFTTEYLLRLLIADRRLAFVFSFYGLIDLAAILPFYLATGLDLRSIRALRLLRLFRILKVARYSRAITRIRTAFRVAREELVLFGAASAVIVYVASVGIYYFEHTAQPDVFASVFHSMWWAVSTLTTVGYGDVYPITAGGRAFTALVLFVGLGVVAVPAGILASALSQARQQGEE
jgi:voltage-gated potassium channel